MSDFPDSTYFFDTVTLDFDKGLSFNANFCCLLDVETDFALIFSMLTKNMILCIF